MLHISWWYLLSGLGFVISIFLFVMIFNSIVILIKKFYETKFDIALEDKTIQEEKFKSINEKYLKIKNICNKIDEFSSDFLEDFEKLIVYIIFIPILIIAINNITFSIRENIRENNYRISTNKKFLTSSNIKYHYYKISCCDYRYRTNEKTIVYIYTIKTLDELLKETYVKIDKDTYVKPYTITEISLNEFLENYEEIIKE